MAPHLSAPRGFAVSQRRFLFPRGKGTIAHGEASFHSKTERGPTADFRTRRTPRPPHRSVPPPESPGSPRPGARSPSAPPSPLLSLLHVTGQPAPRSRTERPRWTMGQQPPLRSALRRRQGLPSACGPHGRLRSRTAPGTAARPALGPAQRGAAAPGRGTRGAAGGSRRPCRAAGRGGAGRRVGLHVLPAAGRAGRRRRGPWRRGECGVSTC